MGKTHKILALFVAVVLIFSLVGCGSNAPNSMETSTKAAESTAKAAESTAKAAESTAKAAESTTKAAESTATTQAKVDYAWEKYDSPVTITAGLRTSPSVVYENKDDDVYNNVWTREIEKVFNIKLKILWAANTNEYNTKLNVTVASGDLPDIYSPNNTSFMQVAKAGLLADLTDVWEKYATPENKSCMEADKVGYDSGKLDGKLFGISAQHWGLIGMPDVIWLRNDWMKKLNLSAPKTIDEFIGILEAFTTKDPDGNGKNDTFGLSVIKELIDTESIVGLASLTGFFNAYHGYPGIWLKNASGQIVYGTVQPEIKTALAKLQEMYKKGFIDREFTLKGLEQVAQDMVSGKSGAEIGQNWNGYYPIPDVIKKNGVDAFYMPYPIPSSDDKPVKLGVGWAIGQYNVVNKNCKNPEAAIKILNLFTKAFNNQEEYKALVNGDRTWISPVSIGNPASSDIEYTSISEAVLSKDVSKLTGISKTKYDHIIDWLDNKNPDSVGYWLQVGPESSFAALKPFFDRGDFVLTEYRGVDTPTMLKSKATLEKLAVEVFSKIIMGAPLDEFDKFVENWNNIGGAAITQEMNDTYNK